MMSGESLRRLKELRRNVLFGVRGCRRCFRLCLGVLLTRPRVTRIEDSRHRKYEVPLSQHHHSIRTIHPYRSLALEVV